MCMVHNILCSYGKGSSSKVPEKKKLLITFLLIEWKSNYNALFKALVFNVM